MDYTKMNELRQHTDDALMRAHQVGLDRAAEILADWLPELDGGEQADGYMDGAEDALNTLIQAGATDPRPEPEPTVVGIETDEGVAYYEV